MSRLVLTAACLISLGMTGCATQGASSQRTDYSDLPGTREMAEGPGLLSGDHYDEQNGGGTLLYSDDSPEHSVFGSVRNDKDEHEAVEQRGQTTARTISHSSSASDRSDDTREYENFEQFRAFQRFQQLPADAPEKQRYKDWKEWQRYQQWQQQNR